VARRVDCSRSSDCQCLTAVGGFPTFAGTHSGDKVAPTADLREVGQHVVGSSQRGRNLLPPNPGLPTEARGTRRGEANSDKVGQRTSKPILGNATIALSITGEAPYATLHLDYERYIRG
jgi:hypothetical protein